MSEIVVIVSGCDDTTKVAMEATEAEIQFLHQVAELITKTSTYGCMPTMSIVSDPAEVAEFKKEKEGGE